MPQEVFIVDCVRTPIGKRNGKLSSLHPVSLLAHVLDALTERSNIKKSEIEDIICGISSPMKEQGSNVPRLALLKAGFPVSVPAVQINRKCGSSQSAIHFISQGIASGDIDIGIACGVEMMSVVPMGSDASFKPALTFNPSYTNDFDVGHPLLHQGFSAEILAKKYNITRQDMEAHAVESHKRCQHAILNNFQHQIVGDSVVTQDEGVRSNATVEQLSKLKPAFIKDGRITAGVSSQISDGASAVLLASEKKCKELGLKKRARIVSRVVIGHDPVTMLDGIIPATMKAVEKAGITIDQIDVFEVNEAFSSVVMCWQKTLNVPWEKINPNGGAIAHGHPLGATGCILTTKLVNELERTNGRYGLQTMCIGGGQGIATVITIDETCT